MSRLRRWDVVEGWEPVNPPVCHLIRLTDGGSWLRICDHAPARPFVPRDEATNAYDCERCWREADRRGIEVRPPGWRPSAVHVVHTRWPEETPPFITKGLPEWAMPVVDLAAEYGWRLDGELTDSEVVVFVDVFGCQVAVGEEGASSYSDDRRHMADLRSTVEIRNAFRHEL